MPEPQGPLAYSSSGLIAIQIWHADIERRIVGSELFGDLKRFQIMVRGSYFMAFESKITESVSAASRLSPATKMRAR
jgi:hypothetical protein